MSENEANIPAGQEPEILVNHDQVPGDPTVVVAEPDRTVVSTKNETIVIDKQRYDAEVMPNNRPRKVYSGMWGKTEIAVFGSSLLLLLAVFILYILLVVPAGQELDQTRAQRDQLEQELISARSKYGGITSTQTQVEKLVASVSDFESYLPVSATGRTALYQRLNGLIAGYGLVNTNGPNYAPLDLADQQIGNGTEQNDQERGRAKFRSIFPGVYVTMTVEGPYQNLRKFINQIETAGEFVIISSVELEPTETKKKEDDPTQPPVQQQPVQQPQFSQGFPGASNSRFNDPRNPTRGMMPVQPVQQRPVERPEGKTHGQTVSLRLEMAAYFRREVAAQPVTQEVQ